MISGIRFRDFYLDASIWGPYSHCGRTMHAHHDELLIEVNGQEYDLVAMDDSRAFVDQLAEADRCTITYGSITRKWSDGNVEEHCARQAFEDWVQQHADAMGSASFEAGNP